MSGVHLNDASVPANIRVYAIGDVHGCAPEFDRLMALIEQDELANPVKKSHLVFLGDYLDRGPDSKGIIDRLLALQKVGPKSTFLMGNHEEKLLQFLKNPLMLASGFFTYGGYETALSYGLSAEDMENPLPNASKIRDTLKQNLPKYHLKLLRKLRTSLTIGDYYFCHAGIRPGVKLRKQSDHDLMWIRQEFLSSAELHPKVIVHGHTPHAEPEVLPNRINVDTKCYDTGILTCLVLEGNTYRFLQTGV